jgi:hypothetical protein
MLDQIRFTRAMLDLDRLRLRYLSLVRDVTGGDERMGRLVDHVLRHGELARGDAGLVLRTGERTARTALKRASDHGFLTSSGPKTPVRIAFPIDYRERLFPDLFTEAPVDMPTPPKPPDRAG